MHGEWRKDAHMGRRRVMRCGKEGEVGDVGMGWLVVDQEGRGYFRKLPVADYDTILNTFDIFH
jgi:hypothetical protein